MLLHILVLAYLFGGTYAGKVCFSSYGKTSGMATQYGEGMPVEGWSGSACVGVPGKVPVQCGLKFSYNVWDDIADGHPLVCIRGGALCWQYVDIRNPYLVINYFYLDNSWRLSAGPADIANIHSEYIPGSFTPWRIHMTFETENCWDILAEGNTPPVPPPDIPGIGTCLDGYYGRGNGKGPAGYCCKDSDDCDESCKLGSCTLGESDIRPSCIAGYYDNGNGDGPADACCKYSDDCISSVCDDGFCTTPVNNCRRKLGNGDGYGGDCCISEGDCREECKSGKCSGPKAPGPVIPPVNPGTNSCITGWCGFKDGRGPVGACCSTESDCDDTCNGNGKCGTDDGTWRGPLDCNRGSKTTSTRSPSPTPTKYCKSGYYSKGLRNAPQGYCCKSPSDCRGNCVHGMCDASSTTTVVPTPTPTGKVCKSGYYGKGLKNAPSSYCCKDTKDCIGSCTNGMCVGNSTSTTVVMPTPTMPSAPCFYGMQGTNLSLAVGGYCCSPGDCVGGCVNGVCTYVTDTKCVGGFEFQDDGSSPAGYCCLDGANSCEGSCVNGVCSEPKPGVCLKCIPGHEGDDNSSLSPEYCCTGSGDCLHGCSDGVCGNGPPPTCPRPTKTTTSTPTSKPSNKDLEFKDIVVDPCKVGCISIPIKFGVGGLVLVVGSGLGIALGILGDDDGDKTTTTFASVVTSVLSRFVTTTMAISDTTNAITSTTDSVTKSTIATRSTITPTSWNATSIIPTNWNTTNVVSSRTTTNTILSSSSTISGWNTSNVIVPTSWKSSTSQETMPMTTLTNVTTTNTVTTFGKSTTVPSSAIMTSTVTSTTIPTGKTCLKGYYSKGLKNGPDGCCCETTKDCIGSCIYVPGNSYMCANGGTTPTVTATSAHATTSGITPSCKSGWCGKRNGSGPIGACCSTERDCVDTCNADGKCGVSDETWRTPLSCL